MHGSLASALLAASNTGQKLIRIRILGLHSRSGEPRTRHRTVTVCVLSLPVMCAVASMINLGVVTLLQHPDQLAALKKVSPVNVTAACGRTTLLGGTATCQAGHGWGNLLDRHPGLLAECVQPRLLALVVAPNLQRPG